MFLSNECRKEATGKSKPITIGAPARSIDKELESIILQICVVVPNFHSGGAQRVAISLANQLSLMGITVTFFALNSRGPLRPDVSEDVIVKPLGDGRGLGAIFRLRENLRDRNPSVVISFMTHVNLITLFVTMTLGISARVIATEHGLLRKSLEGVSMPKKAVIRLLCEYLYPRAFKVVAVSNQLEENLRTELRLARSKVSTIHNGVPISQIRSLARQKPGISLPSSGLKLVVAVGRLVEAKGFGDLIAAFADQDLRQIAKLLIVGEGPLHEDLEIQIREMGISKSVSLVGHQENPYPFFRLADVVVQSSHNEGLPTTIIEALVLRKKIVATDCPTGPREILEGGKWGLLVPVGDPSAMARAIRTALETNPKRPRAQTLEHFSVARMASAYLNLVQNPDSSR